MKKAVFTLFILLLAARSCFYVDDSQYRVEIDPAFNPVLHFTSNFDTIDSIRIVDSLVFKYEISIDTGKLYYADLYLGNLQLFRSDTLADSLWLYPYYINDGEMYDITIIAYFKKYTGSLADILDAEPYIADTSWRVTFFKNLE
ncbi:MAG: hypothetical protein P1P82_05250 [Bacteroidales bacterium]|nr:hypothetical protein [Bacteroidales bacterium]MDT8430846.1 hypothetical protein [Bacteroidales bacterium]